MPDGGSPALAFQAAQLRTGDVLLMRARGPLAALTAWFGESAYSHVALLGRAGYLIEVAAGGVVERALSQRLDDPALIAVDARRPMGTAIDLQDNERIAVLAHALSLRRQGFAGDALAALGRAAALRDRSLPASPQLRAVLSEALGHAAAEPAGAMSASEFVYRCFAENPAQPRGRLAPLLPLAAPSSAPFPSLDWDGLWREIAPCLRPARREALRLDEHGQPASAQHVGEDEFAEALAQARQRLGLMERGNGFLAASGPRLPNPKCVRLRDLESSPSFAPLGALLDAAPI
ncbi:hypothetical protein [Pseudomonas sp. CGJS7]|uniref:hypothetical protein n=1 Tax=Pseudomonas sp. CGJS7 TaxID=3109348 RepID=UPI003009C49B